MCFTSTRHLHKLSGRLALPMSTCSRAGAVQLIALAIQKQVRDSKETHFASDLYFQIPFVLCVCVCVF